MVVRHAQMKLALWYTAAVFLSFGCCLTWLRWFLFLFPVYIPAGCQSLESSRIGHATLELESITLEGVEFSQPEELAFFQKMLAHPEPEFQRMIDCCMGGYRGCYAQVVFKGYPAFELNISYADSGRCFSWHYGDADSNTVYHFIVDRNTVPRSICEFYTSHNK